MILLVHSLSMKKISSQISITLCFSGPSQMFLKIKKNIHRIKTLKTFYRNIKKHKIRSLQLCSLSFYLFGTHLRNRNCWTAGYFLRKKTELHNRFPPFLPPLVPLPFFFPSEGNTPLPKPSDGERCKLSRRVQAEPGHQAIFGDNNIQPFWRLIVRLKIGFLKQKIAQTST